MTLSDLLAERAGTIPDRTCMQFEGEKITYSQLNERVSSAAGGLKTLGLKKNDSAAILMDNCPEYIITYFAILRAGGIAVPVNTFLTPAEIAYILKDAQCAVVVYSDGFLPRVEKIKADLPDVRFTAFNGIPTASQEASSGNEDEVAVLLYTSGTTGFPKGAMLTHRNLISNAEASMKVMNILPKDRILLFLPLFHAFSFTVCVILPIFAGARIILLRSVKPFSKVMKSVFRQRVTFFVAVPTVYNILVRKKIPFLLQLILKAVLNIRACISGAAALPVDTLSAVEKRFGLPLLEGYGLTEASPVVSVNPLRGLRKPSSVGPPVPGVEVAVVGEDGGRLPAGEAGELIVRGPNVMKGYFNRPEDTAAVIREGWLYTGDVAKIDEDGYIYIVDRKKDIIIIDGMNVYPREVEDVILKHPSVEECATVGVPDGRGSETSVLYVKKKEGAVVAEDELRNIMRGRLAAYKIPRKIIFIDEFPKTATGKIRKTELRRMPSAV